MVGIKQTWKNSPRTSVLLHPMSQLHCDQDVAGSGSGDAFGPQLPVFKDKGTLMCLTGKPCVSNPWLTPLIPSPPTHSHCRRDAFLHLISLLRLQVPPGAVNEWNPTVPGNEIPFGGNMMDLVVEEQTSPGSRLSRTPCLFTWIFFPSELLLFLYWWLKPLSPFLPRCSLAPACSPGGPSWQAGGLEQGSTPSSQLQCNPWGKQKWLLGVPAWLSRQAVLFAE